MGALRIFDNLIKVFKKVMDNLQWMRYDVFG